MNRLFCVLFLMAALGLASCSTTSTNTQVQFLCPALSPPPSKAIDALEEAGKSDPSSAAWVIDLSRHYDKCDAINSHRSSKR